MKRFIIFSLVTGFVFSSQTRAFCQPVQASPLSSSLYVSPTGDDADPGTEQAPLASLRGARDAIRRRIQEGTLPDGGLTVYFQGGLYELDRTVVFGPEDSPPARTPVTYAAYPGETPVLTSGERITNWKRLEQAPPALPEVARGHVWVADLPASKNGQSFATLYEGKKRLPRARSKGFFPTVGRREPEDNSTLHYPAHAPIKNWPNLQDVEIVVRPDNPYVLNILKLKSVDEKHHVAKTTIPATYPMGRLGGWGTKNVTASVWVENVLEVLDEPGEWVLNTNEGRLYYWPAGERPGSDIRIPRLQEYIRVEGDESSGHFVRHLEFKGFTLMHGKRDTWTSDDSGLQHDWEIYDKGNALIRLRGAEQIVIQDCHLTNSGGTGIRLDLHAQKNLIAGNELDHLGGTGILLSGYGPGTKDVNKRNSIRNNHIHHCGEIYWHGLAIFVWQSGENRIANNLIDHMPYTAIVISGVRPYFFMNRDLDRREIQGTIRWDEVGNADTWNTTIAFLHARNNVIERNEIHHVVETLGDGNAIYLSGTPEGNVIRENYLHDIYGGTSAIRADDWQQDAFFVRNIIYRCAWGGILLKLAHHVENNIIADILTADENPHNLRLWGYVQVKAGPVYDSRIQRNIFYARHPSDFYYQTTLSGYEQVELSDYAADYNLFYVQDDLAWSQRYVDSLQTAGVEQHSIAADPMFTNPDHADFSLQPSSPAYQLGFQPIDVSKIGLLERKKAGR